MTAPRRTTPGSHHAREGYADMTYLTAEPWENLMDHTGLEVCPAGAGAGSAGAGTPPVVALSQRSS